MPSAQTTSSVCDNSPAAISASNLWISTSWAMRRFTHAAGCKPAKVHTGLSSGMFSNRCSRRDAPRTKRSTNPSSVDGRSVRGRSFGLCASVVSIPWNIAWTLHMWNTNSAAFQPGHAATGAAHPDACAAAMNFAFSSDRTCRWFRARRSRYDPIIRGYFNSSAS